MYTTVHVFNYQHRHGTDTGVYPTHDLALKNAAFIMLEWWEDFRDVATAEACASMFGLIRLGKYEQAITLWNQIMEDELMSIEEYSVNPFPEEEEARISKTLDGMLECIEKREEEERSRDDAVF